MLLQTTCNDMLVGEQPCWIMIMIGATKGDDWWFGHRIRINEALY
jgi:hypothetical protein